MSSNTLTSELWIFYSRVPTLFGAFERNPIGAKIVVGNTIRTPASVQCLTFKCKTMKAVHF